jgi:hypothetical protein
MIKSKRYNNDVARAADFIFSGNDISDDEDEQKVLSIIMLIAIYKL